MYSLNEPDQHQLKNRNIFYDALHRGQMFSFSEMLVHEIKQVKSRTIFSLALAKQITLQLQVLFIYCSIFF